MNEPDERIIRLLEEIRDNQVKQIKLASEYTEKVKKDQDAYTAQLAKYQDSQDAFKRTQEQFQVEEPKRSVAATIILGIIAVCLVIGLILRFMGK